MGGDAEPSGACDHELETAKVVSNKNRLKAAIAEKKRNRAKR